MALPLHFDIPAAWTIHRQDFKLGKGDDKVFDARVDGYLLSKVDKNIKAIIEVKAMAREFGLVAIRRQEVAQMAAWISSEPDLKKQERYRYQFIPLIFARRRRDLSSRPVAGGLACKERSEQMARSSC